MFMISMIDTNHEKLFIAWGIKHDFKLSDDLTHVLIALFTFYDPPYDPPYSIQQYGRQPFAEILQIVNIIAFKMNIEWYIMDSKP